MYKYLLSIVVLLVFISSASAGSDLDSVSFATYYPAPYGVYHEMRTDQQSIGVGYRDNVVPVNGLIVEGNVGIGKINPITTQGGKSVGLDVADHIVAKDIYLRAPVSGGSGRWASDEGGLLLL